jgi:TPR repeat protein
VRRSAARAVLLYEQAALSGHLQAQTNLAGMMLEGDGCIQDTAAGLLWMRRAARRGSNVIKRHGLSDKNACRQINVLQ